MSARCSHMRKKPLQKPKSGSPARSRRVGRPQAKKTRKGENRTVGWRADDPRDLPLGRAGKGGSGPHSPAPPPPFKTVEAGEVMEKHLLRVGEAAQMLNVSRWTIYRWVEEGRLEATKLNKGSLRVFRASLTALVDGNRMMEEYEATRPARASTPTLRAPPSGR